MYVHAAADGGIFVIDGETGVSSWVTLAELVPRLDRLRTINGAVLLSSEHTKLAGGAVDAVRSAGLPVTESPQVHPDAMRREGVTTLMVASHGGSLNLVRDLLDRGADLNAGDIDGYTALMYAAVAGHHAVVGRLVHAGANVNAQDRDGSTALMFAAQNGHIAVITRLLAGGADPKIHGPDGLTALDFATQHDRSAAVGVLRAAAGL